MLRPLNDRSASEFELRSRYLREVKLANVSVPICNRNLYSTISDFQKNWLNFVSFEQKKWVNVRCFRKVLKLSKIKYNFFFQKSGFPGYRKKVQRMKGKGMTYDLQDTSKFGVMSNKLHITNYLFSFLTNQKIANNSTTYCRKVIMAEIKRMQSWNIVEQMLSYSVQSIVG